MSIKQVENFYEMLHLEPELYKLYYQNCGQPGVFESYHWDTKKIVNFATNLGYEFTELELKELLFAPEPVRL